MNREQRIKSREQRAGRFICLILLYLLLCINIYAQEVDNGGPMRLTPDDAVQRAIKNNLSLETARINTATKKRTYVLWWNQFIPNVTAAGSIIRDNEASKYEGFQPVDMADVLNPFVGGMFPPETLYGVYPYSVDAPQWHVAGTIQASLNISFALFQGVKLLRQDYESGLISYEKSKAQLERDIRKAYHNIMLLQENIALLRLSYENVGRQMNIALANYNAGLAPELTYLQARVARENMRPVIEQAENGLRLLMAQFAMYLGFDKDTPFELLPVSPNIDFIPLDVAEMISKAAAGKPDIQELRHQIMMLQTLRKVRIASLTPALSFSWNYNSVFIRDPWKDAWFESKDNWNKSGSLTISVALRLHSLIPLSVDFQDIKNTEDQIKTASLGLAQLVRGTEIEVYNTVLSLEHIRTTTAAQAETVRLAQQAYRLTEQAYQAGLQDYFQVQNAEQSLRQARVQMLEQQFNYLNGLIDLEYSLGVPFGTLSKESQ